MNDKFLDRTEAGTILANMLSAYQNHPSVIVLALPRGGVPIGYQIAKQLQVPLDVFIVRKLGVPFHPELAMGAIASGDVCLFNEDVIDECHITLDQINEVISTEKVELNRRNHKYRNHKPPLQLNNKIVILVDDGIATGATIKVAILALKKLQLSKLIVAVPVAQKDICKALSKLVDEFYCPLQPIHLYAVGSWYAHFEQTEDKEVSQLLAMSE